MESWLTHGARALPPLNIGYTATVQDQYQSYCKPGRLNKSAIETLEGKVARSISASDRTIKTRRLSF